MPNYPKSCQRTHKLRLRHLISWRLEHYQALQSVRQGGLFWTQHLQWAVDPRQSSPSPLVPRTQQPQEERPEHAQRLQWGSMLRSSRPSPRGSAVPSLRVPQACSYGASYCCTQALLQNSTPFPCNSLGAAPGWPGKGSSVLTLLWTSQGLVIADKSHAVIIMALWTDRADHLSFWTERNTLS